MATTATFPRVSPPTQPIANKMLLAGVALSSFSALLLELSLTRLFSVVLFYHFAFLAISIALLGLGAGGVFAHLRKSRLQKCELRKIAANCAALTALSVPVVLEVVLHTPVSLKLTAGNFLRLSVIYLFSAVPFFLTGIQFSVIFARMSDRIPRLYGADLGGGALACLGVVPLLNWIGGPNAILFSAVTAAVAAVIWSVDARTRKWTAGLGVLLLLAIILNHSGKIADIVWAKGVRQKNVEFSRWNAISRVEVDRTPDNGRLVVIDADASTHIMNADPQKWNGSQWQKWLMAAPPAVVNVLRPHGDYAIIGPGGGVDVLRAVANGSHSVTGIEINSIIARTIMQHQYADFAYHLYQRPDVHIHVADGRSFIRNAPNTFDVVQMTLVDTWASTAAGAFALSENSLYTTEAFREYLEHVKPNGIVAVTRWEFQRPREALRVASVAMNALHQIGVTDTASHFIVISQNKLDEDGIHVGVLAKKSPFTPDEEAAVRHHLANNPPMQVLYSPSGQEDNAFSQLIKSNDPYAFSANYAYNVTPVSDNAPFFFFTLKPEQLLHLHTRHSMDWKVNLGVAILAMLLVISVIAVLAFLILPLLMERGQERGSALPLLYFVAIGLGYILVEITFIQRFVLFLGHPTYALTVVVFLMLLASGAGSVLSRKWLAEPRRVWIPLLAIVLALAFYVQVLPSILNRLVGVSFVEKLGVSALLLVPLGLAMGMPFPAGLRLLDIHRAQTTNSIEWAWAMNAASSVLGSVLAICIAIEYGLNITLACGAATYLLALLLRGKLLPRPSAI
ncbi:MAG TPA: class I SAM-dependent methyltransferase [Terriglobales bacterium]|nr:class I SAM-dependent methyltransferase [Terriglobales bacterium]